MTPASRAPGASSEGMTIARIASRTRASRSVKNRKLLLTPPQPAATPETATAADPRKVRLVRMASRTAHSSAKPDIMSGFDLTGPFASGTYGDEAGHYVRFP